MKIRTLFAICLSFTIGFGAVAYADSHDSFVSTSDMKLVNFPWHARIKEQKSGIEYFPTSEQFTELRNASEQRARRRAVESNTHYDPSDLGDLMGATLPAESLGYNPKPTLYSFAHFGPVKGGTYFWNLRERNAVSNESGVVVGTEIKTWTFFENGRVIYLHQYDYQHYVFVSLGKVGDGNYVELGKYMNIDARHPLWNEAVVKSKRAIQLLCERYSCVADGTAP